MERKTVRAKLQSHDWSAVLLWTVYLSLLGVLLPHTAWAFGQFEPIGSVRLGWVAAIAFEGAIAAFTWRIKKRIETTPQFRKNARRRTFAYRYLNSYSVGLMIATVVSTAANWAHAVEFGKPFAVFATYSVSPWLYSLAFGAILPLCSVLFARVLAETQDTEVEQDEALLLVKDELKGLKHQLSLAERRANEAEEATKGLLRLVAEDKAERIRAAQQMWPRLPRSAIAVITDASPGYVTEVLGATE
jgi:hypothetical protein